MRILVACEESQTVCMAFRAKGHEAYSCDIQPCSGGHPEWHVQGDALRLIDGDCAFETMDGHTHTIDGQWDLLIAHPPCTYLSCAGNSALSPKSRNTSEIVERVKKRREAAAFFMQFVFARCQRRVIENPVGFMNTRFRPADCIIHPYMFGDNAMKRTCLWCFGVPPLKPTCDAPPPEPTYTDKTGRKRYYTDAISGRGKGAAKLRSKTFPGIAEAMAEQWGTLV